MGFLGQSEHPLDKKSRLHLPKRILAEIPEEERSNLVLARGLDGCLYLYPPKKWEAYELSFTAVLPPASRRARTFQRLFFSSAQKVAVDSQGRILIPDVLKQTAQLKDRVLIIGTGPRAELWNPVTFTNVSELDGGEAAFDQMYQELLRDIGNLGGSA